MQTSRDIPDPVKRTVRQFCRFACVVCGCPLFDYDHIEDFSDKPEHDPNNLVLLCPTHHRMKTNGLISRADVRKFREAAPSRQATAWEKLFVEPRLVDVGSNQCVSTKYFFVVNSRHYLASTRASGDHPALYGAISDENGQLLVLIVDGHISFSSQNWDVEFTGREILIRQAPRDILLRLVLNPEDNGILLRGNLPLYDDSRLNLRDDGIRHRGRLLAKGCSAYNVRCALFVAERASDPAPLAGFRNCVNVEDSVAHNLGADSAGFLWTSDFLRSLA